MGLTDKTEDYAAAASNTALHFIHRAEKDLKQRRELGPMKMETENNRIEEKCLTQRQKSINYRLDLEDTKYAHGTTLKLSTWSRILIMFENFDLFGSVKHYYIFQTRY